MRKISVIVPMHNESAVFATFMTRIVSLAEKIQSEYEFEVVIVDDGSDDNTWSLIVENSGRYHWIKGVKLSRNFGHQKALTCGHHLATGDAVIDIDADLQDPPELIPEMVKAWEEGADVVLCKRKIRTGETWAKLATARLFYRLMSYLSEVELHENVGDFRLISRRVNEEFVKMTEKSRYVRGMISWMGYRTHVIEYDRQTRAAGLTHYPFRKMQLLAVNGIVSMSSRPLKLAYVMAMAGSFPFLAYLALAYVRAEIQGVQMVPGWTSTILTVVTFGAMTLFMLGVIGEYIARIYEESKPRALFLVDAIARDGGQEMPEDIKR